MKRVFLFFLCVLVGATGFAQMNSGQGFNYQAVVRGGDGSVLPLQNVELRFTLMPDQHATEASWVETHSVTTDAFGTFSVRVGTGVKVGGTAASFVDVPFVASHHWMKVEIKEGAVWSELSWSALPSVPYAEVAANAAGNAEFDRNFATIREEIEDLFAALNAELDLKVSQSVPVGTIVPFGGEPENIPEGWLLCDGSEMSRSEYAVLFKAIGTAWGSGSSSVFNLPDMRGVFLRGVNGSSFQDQDTEGREQLKTGGNTGNAVGSFQHDAIRNITGGGLINYAMLNGAFRFKSKTLDGGIEPGSWWVEGWGDAEFDASRVVPTGSDNRPKNVYVHYIIKY